MGRRRRRRCNCGTRNADPGSGPRFPFTNSVPLVVNCDSQEEIDRYWEKLAADGGEQIQCGWLKDKFGMPWQIVRARFGIGCAAKIPREQRVTAALWQMEKLDLAEPKHAAWNARPRVRCV